VEQGLRQEAGQEPHARENSEHGESGVLLPPTNLRPQPTSFIGRGTDLAEVKHLLVQTQFVTLAGTGGCGKTRLAQRVGKEALAHYTDWRLAGGTGQHSLTPPAAGLIASALALPEQPGQTLLETLVAALQNKQMLLILVIASTW